MQQLLKDHRRHTLKYSVYNTGLKLSSARPKTGPRREQTGNLPPSREATPTFTANQEWVIPGLAG